MKDDKLEKATRSLPRSLAPRRDLWPGVRNRIRMGPERRSSSFKLPRLVWAPPLLIAAALLVAIGLGRVWSPSPTRAALPETIDRLESECARANADVTHLLAQSTGVSESTQAVFTTNLRLIDDAIRETEMLLTKHPDDVELAVRLTAGYEEKLSLLRKATAVYSTARLSGELNEGDQT